MNSEMSVPNNKHRFGESAGTMDIFAPLPRRVLFCNAESGYDHDVALCAKLLRPGSHYEVGAIEVGDFHTTIELTEFPGIRFNSVMFIDWPPPPPDDALRVAAKNLISGLMVDFPTYAMAIGNDWPPLVALRAALAGGKA